MKAFPAPHPEIPPTPTTGWGSGRNPACLMTTMMMTMWSQITVIIPIVPTKLQALECVFCFLLVFSATQGGTLYYSIVQLTEEATEAQLTEVI